MQKEGDGFEEDHMCLFPWIHADLQGSLSPTLESIHQIEDEMRNGLIQGQSPCGNE